MHIHVCNFKKIFKVKMGTAIPFMKFMYGGKIAEEHTLTTKGNVLNPGHANKKNSVYIQNVRYLL